jgi:hypothetical protein
VSDMEACSYIYRGRICPRITSQSCEMSRHTMYSRESNHPRTPLSFPAQLACPALLHPHHRVSACDPTPGSHLLQNAFINPYTTATLFHTPPPLSSNYRPRINSTPLPTRRFTRQNLRHGRCPRTLWIPSRNRNRPSICSSVSNT